MEIKAEIQAEVKAQVKAEVRAGVKAEVRAEVKAEVRAEAKAAARAVAPPAKAACSTAVATRGRAAVRSEGQPSEAPRASASAAGGLRVDSEGGSDFGQLALLRRLHSAPDHAPGCFKLRPASAHEPLLRLWLGHTRGFASDTGGLAYTPAATSAVAAAKAEAPQRALKRLRGGGDNEASGGLHRGTTSRYFAPVGSGGGR